ncbi:carboxypeptidase S [Phanerochaete sordida]|uniref:Carboxypeptidase S n=1 Tax=Phanerochaete sordida TaxID=48140 RepID=A0A9P3G866_9APHY|nr:carboxypeptidase S [Phanerochaete sordida]
MVYALEPLLLLCYLFSPWVAAANAAEAAQSALQNDPGASDRFAAATEYCPQFSALHPRKHRELDITLQQLFTTNDFLLQVVEALSAAVHVPTESYDDFGPVGRDPRWQPFFKLHDELERLFPLVYEKLRVTKVNTHALVFHWQGADESLKPVLLMAHMDVVPVEPSTVSSWVHPPYSGHYDGTYVWGRGTCDDKSVVLAFGIDEESAGVQGAGHIAKHLEHTYGQDSFALIVDEGEPFDIPYGGNVIFANPYVTEKGYFDLRIEVSAPGGHSSVPPRHTAIGVLASILTEIEAHPYEPHLPRNGTLFQEVQCAAAHGPDVSAEFKNLARAAITSDAALEALTQLLLAHVPLSSAKLATTQAVDLIAGGAKANALPETAWAVVNHRIAEQSSVAALQERIAATVGPVASRHGLALDAFGRTVVSGSSGRISLSDAWGTALEPAPVTPTRDNPAYALLAGTIVAALGEYHNASGVIVQPTYALGNTDTQFYWNMSRNIFRYAHMPADAYYNGLHTVNEAIKPTALVGKIGFLVKLILNLDEASV